MEAEKGRKRQQEERPGAHTTLCLGPASHSAMEMPWCELSLPSALR